VPGRLLQLPNHKQQEESDCLAAYAAMMLGAIGLTLPYTKLLSILNVAAWGTPHRNITRLVELVPNIRVVYKQGELPDLLRAIDAGYPPVAFVWTGELPYWSLSTWHAVVVVGYDEQSVLVNDPAFEVAPQVVSRGDFDLAWIAYDAYYAFIEQVV
jgi:ABC-type bacteriocin/lantibiotic exporter with double-glycine peptidase domain